MLPVARAERPTVAVIGAGLAGLAAAYHLRKKARVTVFEREVRLGGRILTSKRLRGEQGAQFFLSRKNEPTIHKLIKELGLPLISWNKDWPGYVFRGKFSCGDPSKTVDALLAPESARRVKGLFKLVKKEAWLNPRGKFNQWLSDRLKKDREAIAFVEMLLAGETCAPANHITARYGLECLSSIYDSWYSVCEGSGKFAEELAQKSTAKIVFEARAAEVKEAHVGVRVKWWKNQEKKSRIFRAVIIATPDGEQLIGKPAQGHFHAYISIILGYRRRPRLKAKSNFDLSRGLYTDGSLNYLQLARRHESYALRILIPNAENMLGLKNHDVVTWCIRHLRQFITGADQFHNQSVKKWKFGFPCGGNGKKDRGFLKSGRRVFIAGDRFGQWPSMDAAISSGMKSAKASLNGQILRGSHVRAQGLSCEA